MPKTSKSEIEYIKENIKIVQNILNRNKNLMKFEKVTFEKYLNECKDKLEKMEKQND